MLVYTCISCGQQVGQYDIGDPGHRCQSTKAIMWEHLCRIHAELRMAQDKDGQPSLTEDSIDEIMRLVRKLSR